MIHIAIVEDDKIIAGTLAGFCEKFASEQGETVKIEFFSSGMDFISPYKPVDIILMDIQMPHIDGYQTLKK